MGDRDLEIRVEGLAREIAQLKEQVATLLAGAAPATRLPAEPPPTATGAGVDAGEELLDWMGKSALLPRIAAICFLLVVALILRTVTDSGILAPQLGSLAGMAYAALLVGIGWYGYRRERPLAPVFTVCGAVLMYVIVGETHARFESLPSMAAYLILLLTGGVSATISYQSGRPLPVLVGTLGMGLAGVAIDYPSPYYPYVALLLLIANLFGAFATRLQRCSWLRWMLLILTALMMQVWGLKLAVRGRQLALEQNSLAEPLFLPVLALLAVVLFALGIVAVVRRGSERPSRFDLCLPTATALWVFAAASPVLRKHPEHLALLGLFWLLLSLGAALLASRLRHKENKGRGSVVAYMIAAIVLLGTGMWALTGGVLPALVALSLAAWRLAVLGRAWENGGLRGISYLLQVACGTALALVLLQSDPSMAPYVQMFAAGMLAAAALWQYRWCRRVPFPDDGGFFCRIDREDRSAVLLLLSALICGFFLLRPAIYLAAGGGQGGAGAFQAGQSVVVTTAAAGLMLLAYFRGRNRELRNVGVLVALVAAGRVFLFDLFRVRGVPLVLSVLTFGMAISLISVALTRWSHRPVQAGEEEGIPAEEGRS